MLRAVLGSRRSHRAWPAFSTPQMAADGGQPASVRACGDTAEGKCCAGEGYWSGGAAVFVNEPAEDVNPLDASSRLGAASGVWLGDGDVEVEAAVRAGAVVVPEVVGQDSLKVATVPDQDPVQALGPQGAYPSFGVGVRPGRPRRDLEHVDASGCEHGVEGSAELGITSRMRNPNLSACWSRSMSRLRAAWVTHAPAGWAVTPARCTLR